jgi:hypothetical protein
MHSAQVKVKVNVKVTLSQEKAQRGSRGTVLLFL